VQMRDRPDNATYLGEGKIEELRDLAISCGAELVVFDDELTPSQIKNIEDRLENIRVIDRTMLILDIFAGRAKTSEGILQVEIARLKYTMPRLLGKGAELSRLGGGIGTRGPGESKLESDRRHIKRRITALTEDLKELERKRSEQRKTRKKSGIPQIAIAGYTNAGKSTLLNALTDAGIFAEDKLFATLDPTTRRLELPEAGEALLTDTVGFIDRLPHHLVEAFRSTLEEVTFADIIIVLMDASDERVRKHYEVTQNILSDLFKDKERSKILYVFNKCDRINKEELFTGFSSSSEAVFISALEKTGLDDLIKALEKLITEDRIHVSLSLPVSKGGILSALYESAYVKKADYVGAFIDVEAVVDQKMYGTVKQYEKHGGQ